MASYYMDYRNYLKTMRRYYKVYNAYTKAKRTRYAKHRYDFIPLIKWMPNLCKMLGLGRTVRRNKRRKVKR
jgi:hypothetical protein